MKKLIITLTIILFSAFTIAAQQPTQKVDWQQEAAKLLIELSKEKALKEAAERERDNWKAQSEVWRNLFLEEREIVKKTIVLDATREAQIENLNKQLSLYEKAKAQDTKTISELSDKLKKAGGSKFKWFVIGLGTGIVLRSTVSW